MGRLGMLSIVYRVGHDPEILQRINEELTEICHYEDWNPTHYVDASQITLAVAITVDWVGDALPPETVKLARASLIEKGLRPTLDPGAKGMGWIGFNMHQSRIGHAGVIAAALVIADTDPELAAQVIARALEKLPNSLKEFSPNGTHVEGPNFWRFGTIFTVLISDMLNSSFGRDFGVAGYPGVIESGYFRQALLAPSGKVYGYGDSDESTSGETTALLAWFAAKTGDELLLDQAFLSHPTEAGRLSGYALIWLSQFERKKQSEFPLAWFRAGTTPVAVFRSPPGDSGNLYLGFKGGSEQITRVDMDAGSFVLELNGVRWSIDKPDIDTDRIKGGGSFAQDSPRWELLSKGNQGHSTIRANHARFNVNGYAPIINFQAGDQPEATVDLSAAMQGQLTSLQRRFVKESNQSVLIEDRVQLSEATKSLTWQMMTVAGVTLTEHGAILRQDGQELHLQIISPQGLQVSVISLDPPPLSSELALANFKRLEIRIPAYTIKGQAGLLQVRLSGAK
ncbi:MAG: hypothetical protein ABIV50_10280 [Opitutus sp.]